MKTLLPLIFVAFLLICTISVKAQTVSEVKYASLADVKVFQQATQDSADLVVYMVASATDAGSNNGLWYMAAFPDATTKKIFFVSNAADADIKIYYATSAAGAGWLNTAKASLMN